MRPIWVGVLMFLPVPLVLALFTQTPLGLPASLAIGVALVATHRLYARPFALRYAPHRCLWCGRQAATPRSVIVVEPGGETEWSVCSSAHRQRLLTFLGWAERHATFLRVGILGTLFAFLAGSLAAGWSAVGPWTPADLSAGFRGLIALTVLPLGWLGLRGEPVERPRIPFPVHIQALIGSFWVMVLFRVVGIFWLGVAFRHLYLRAFA